MKNWKLPVSIFIFIVGVLLISGIALPKYDNVRRAIFVENPRLFTLTSEDLPTFTEKFEELKTEIILAGNQSSTKPLLAGQNFKATYRGWLASTGEIFDQTLSIDGINGVASLSPTSLIQGFRDGAIGMQLGEVRRIFIPSTLGYGEEGSELIPANSDLVFDVELISF